MKNLRSCGMAAVDESSWACGFQERRRRGKTLATIMLAANRETLSTDATNAQAAEVITV